MCSLEDKPSEIIQKKSASKHIKKICWFQIFLFITMLSSLKLREKNPSIIAPGAHILLGFDDAWLFETPRINNHSVTAPVTLIVLGD